MDPIRSKRLHAHTTDAAEPDEREKIHRPKRLVRECYPEEGSVGPGNEDVNGAVIENGKDVTCRCECEEGVEEGGAEVESEYGEGVECAARNVIDGFVFDAGEEGDAADDTEDDA